MDKNPKSVNSIPLSELIDAIRQDLIDSAAKRSPDWKPLFQIKEAVVETTVTFQRDMKFGGKLSIWIAEIAPEAAEQSGAAHRLSITLVPIDHGTTEQSSPPGTQMVVHVPSEQNPIHRGSEAPPDRKRKK